MKVFISVLLLILAGCTSTPMPDQLPPEQLQELQRLQNWRITGKLGYRSSENAGSAWLDWQQDRDNFTLFLNGPFGAGATRIEGTDTHATLYRNNEEPVSADSPLELTQQLFGWAWPVEELVFWVRGMPYPSTPAKQIQRDDLGLISKLQQSGWQLNFSNYRQAGNGLLLPGKIIGNRQQISFTLVIKSWQLETVDAS